MADRPARPNSHDPVIRSKKQYESIKREIATAVADVLKSGEQPRAMHS
jgi:hypothetical protein